MIDRLKLAWDLGAPPVFKMAALAPVMVWRTVAGARGDRDGRVLAPTRREAGTWGCSACGETVDVSGPHVSIDIHSEDQMTMEKYHRRCAPGELGERGER